MDRLKGEKIKKEERELQRKGEQEDEKREKI
jgi:hypothetical protein